MNRPNEIEATWQQPAQLEDAIVRLELLTLGHQLDLESAAADGELWKLWFTTVPEPGEATVQYIDQALRAQQAGLAMPFVVRDRESGRVVGSTRFCNMDAKNKRVEIGYTWYAKSTQRTGVNTSCKLLLLRFAFEQLRAIAVELRTHRLNRSSRQAIERLGAQLDGVLRNHQRLADGTIRDTAVYSILNTEWVTVERNLRYLLDRHRS